MPPLATSPGRASSEVRQRWLPAAKCDDARKGSSIWFATVGSHHRFGSLNWQSTETIHIHSGKTLCSENAPSPFQAAPAPRPPARAPSVPGLSWPGVVISTLWPTWVQVNANALQCFPTENHAGVITKRFNTWRQGNVLTAIFSDMKVLRIIP